MPSDHPRINRERKTVEGMIRIYCRDKHPGGSVPCSDCREVLNHAWRRLEKCPFQEGKTTCVRCPVHCFTPAMREKIRAVMRYAGPRMTFRHPLLALRHLLDKRRKEPLPPRH